MDQPIRKPDEIAALLVKICKIYDDRAGQAIWNALAMKYGRPIPDFFGIEDEDLLEILEAYYKESKTGNDEVRKGKR